MGWLAQVMAVLSVIERVTPLVERWLPHGSGADKSTIVKGSGQVVSDAVLGVNLEDPDVAPLVQAKINADVALANKLQEKALRQHAQPDVTTVPILDTVRPVVTSDPDHPGS